MPKCSVLEVCLEDEIDFEHKENMTATILDKTISLAVEIQRFIEDIN